MMLQVLKPKSSHCQVFSLAVHILAQNHAADLSYYAMLIDLLISNFLMPEFTGNATEISNPIGIGGTRKLRWYEGALDILNESEDNQDE